MTVPNPICWLEAVARSVGSLIRDGIPTEGHHYREVESDVPARVQVLKCERCGKVSISWERVK